MDYEEEGGEDEYEYFETPEEENAAKAYVKRMIKDAKDQDGQFRRPDYKPGSSSKELDEKEYESPVVEEKEEKPKTEEKKKEEYDL
ncbi:MAG: hypothetical protein GTN76_11435 [Candidatus Aenigmarchaeota archaeon]|nr:hypothetical protein [Candidatus Aenigmarchaeota archaeon]NIQ18040.1 hypothetical protein [Candidatus Aenigmarchaeota archaeon]